MHLYHVSLKKKEERREKREERKVIKRKDKKKRTHIENVYRAYISIIERSYKKENIYKERRKNRINNDMC